MVTAKAHPLTPIRQTRRISLRALATEMHCDVAHLSRIERFKVLPSPDLANRMAKFFANEVTRDQLLFPNEPPAAASKKPVRAARPEETR